MNSPSGSAQVFITLSTRREASSALVSEVETTAWRVAERLEAREERRARSVDDVDMSERSAGRRESVGFFFKICFFLLFLIW